MKGFILLLLAGGLAACGQKEESAPLPINTGRELTLLDFTGESAKPNCRFLGTFQNSGKFPIESGRITVEILNNNDRSLGSSSALLDVKPLAVGASSTFKSDAPCHKGKLSVTGLDTANNTAIKVIM